MSSRNWVAIAIVTLSCGPALVANILVNPGFESGALAPWYSPTQQWSVTTAQVHSGTYSATDVGNNQIRQDFAPIPTAQITEVSFWLKQPEAQISAIDFFYSNGSSEENLVFLSGTDWQLFNVTSWLDAGKQLAGLGIWGYSGGPPGEDRTYLDDVTITPEPAAITLLAAVGALFLRRRH